MPRFSLKLSFPKMKISYGLCHLAVTVLVYGFMDRVRSQQSCSSPDVPSEGKYDPKQNKFLPGDKVVYTCKEGFTLLGRDIRTCKTNGGWSDQTPFCDRPAKLKNPRATNGFWTTLSYLIDDNTDTCFVWKKSTGHSLQVYIDDRVVVHAIRIFLERGTTKIQIQSGKDNDMKVCCDFDRYLERSQWVLMNCQNNDVFANSIKITNIAPRESNITICEIQVYVKDEYGCEHPPDVQIANGFFEVSRNKATLQCEEGFTPANRRLVCESNTWKGLPPKCDENLCEPHRNYSSPDPGVEWIFLDSVRKLSPGTRKQLHCSPGYHKVGGPEMVTCQKNGMWSKTNATCHKEKSKLSTRTIVIGAVGTVVFIIILLLLGITIYLIKKQRNREVVVVFKPSTDSGMMQENEYEYTAAYYESIQVSAPPMPPTTPRPSPLPPVLNEVYILPEECKRTLKKHKTMPADIAFGTLKQSELYGK